MRLRDMLLLLNLDEQKYSLIFQPFLFAVEDLTLAYLNNRVNVDGDASGTSLRRRHIRMYAFLQD